MNTKSAIRLLALFVLTLSMTSIPSLASTVTPNVPLVRADHAPPAPSDITTQWAPSGPAMDKMLVSTYSDETSEFSALKAGSLDVTDWTLSSTDLPVTCPSGTAILCDSRFYVTAPVANYGMFGINFNHANTFFGIPFNFGKDAQTGPCPNNDCTTAAINFRQAIAHLVSRPDFISNVLGGLGQAMDNPLPPGQGATHSGLPFDGSSTGTGSYTNGGYTLGGVCSWDVLNAQFVAAGQVCQSAYKYASDTVDSAGIVNVGQPDFCDAAAHFIAAGLANGQNSDCTLNGHLTNGLAATGAVISFIVRLDNHPRLVLGQGLAARLCQLINGAGVTACSQINVSLLSIQQARPIVFATDKIHLDWHMYMEGWGLGVTFEQVWSLYNGAFASNACGGVFGPLDTDYSYWCNAKFDHFSNMIEFNSTSAGATASLQVALDIYGSHVTSLEVYAQAEQFAYLKGWSGVNNEAGIGPPNVYTLMNAWTASPTIGPAGTGSNLSPYGTVRWGFKQGTSDVNTLGYTTQWEAYVVQSVYDSLIGANPYSPNDLFGWMVNQYKFLPPQPGDPSGTASDVAFNLRNDIFFHDGTQVTASDYVFSWQAFANTGGLVNPLTAGIVGVKVLNDFNFVVNLNSNSVFALFNVGGIWMIPQHIWATDTTTKCVTPGTPSCTLNPTLFSPTTNVDPVSTDRYIGSGPWVCFDTAANKAGGKCTSSGTGAVPFGGTIVLQRDGLGQSGTANTAYFRNNAKYKQWQWANSIDTGTSQGIVDILDVSAASACLNKAPTGSCAHWDTPAATITCVTTAGTCNSGSLAGLGGNKNGVAVSFLEVQQAFRWFNVAWTSPIAYGLLTGALAVPQTVYEGGVTYGP